MITTDGLAVNPIWVDLAYAGGCLILLVIAIKIGDVIGKRRTKKRP